MKRIITFTALITAVLIGSAASANHYRAYVGYCQEDENQYRIVSFVATADGEKMVEWTRDFTMTDEEAQKELDSAVRKNVPDPENHPTIIKRKILGHCPNRS